MGGGFVAGLLASFASEDPDQAIDHMAELILRTLGLDVAEAARIAHQPLTPLANPITGELLQGERPMKIATYQSQRQDRASASSWKIGSSILRPAASLAT